ncbi:hypothetical protein [Vibrio phage Va2]|nr:hypothetical protein [Vibrio phage Va2]
MPSARIQFRVPDEILFKITERDSTLILTLDKVTYRVIKKRSTSKSSSQFYAQSEWFEFSEENVEHFSKGLSKKGLSFWIFHPDGTTTKK